MVARHDRFDGIMAADAALRAGLTTHLELMSPLRTATGWPGVRQARGIVGAAVPLAESPLESIIRLRLADDGFKRVEPQREFRDPRNGRFDRVDLLVDGRLVVEADGRDKYTNDEWWDEKRRERRLRRHGLLVERVIWDDVTRDWGGTALRLREALAAARRLSP